ncbi:portal protein [Roseobacter phage RDJL Phi 2]|uniref:Portal protein n=1 Tax=Roseobacter phage RDJL Phi 2 TaxID=1682380 RepID=A0A0K0PVI7_9CAUD|nr:portal protein [Roseobacter phage RDJL Phi 2]AKQ75846.1 hypothetical protein RDJLphi2_gp56 [Roseobacter phage RDJL Phi 2]
MAPKPLEALGALLGRNNKKTVAPTDTAGAPGVAVHGGVIQVEEKNANLASREERYKTYSEILANTSIVAAGTRYFLNLTAKAEWGFTPSDKDTDGKFAELAEEILTKDPKTPWHRIVRRAAMYRFYGFSIQEWTARRRDDGILTLADVAPRAQSTITKWDLLDDGSVQGVIQQSPQTMAELYIPRQKVLYLVDDTLSDSPEGLGLFRHLTAPAQRLARYEQLEGFGFETDLRGIPVGRAPFTDLAAAVKAGEITQAQRIAIEKPLRDFIQNHVKSAKLGMLLDSITYETKDEAGRPSSAKQWEIELLKGSATSFKENAEAIERINREMARILGVEQLLLGEGNGSYALSADKTSSFFLLVDGALTEIREAVADDLLTTIWQLNGWDPDMKPELTTEAVRHTDVQEVAAVLRDMASAGAVLDLNDPIINEVRDLLGLSHAPEQEDLGNDEDAALTGNSGKKEEGSVEDGEGDLPEDETQEGK